MGVNTLVERTEEVITPGWVNDIRSALCIDFVPRNSSGIPENEAGDLGTLDYQWNRLRVRQIIVDGSPLETSAVQGRRYRIDSGKANAASGFPDFLSAAGTGNGLVATLDGTTTVFQALANGETISISSTVRSRPTSKQWIDETRAAVDCPDSG